MPWGHILSREEDGLRPGPHTRAICLSPPETKETLTWGQPHFRVGEKIFAGCGDEKGRTVIGFKLDMDHADATVARLDAGAPEPIARPRAAGKKTAAPKTARRA